MIANAAWKSKVEEKLREKIYYSKNAIDRIIHLGEEHEPFTFKVLFEMFEKFSKEEGIDILNEEEKKFILKELFKKEIDDECEEMDLTNITITNRNFFHP